MTRSIICLRMRVVRLRRCTIILHVSVSLRIHAVGVTNGVGGPERPNDCRH
jgi:hypothetical protein